MGIGAISVPHRRMHHASSGPGVAGLINEWPLDGDLLDNVGSADGSEIGTLTYTTGMDGTVNGAISTNGTNNALILPKATFNWRDVRTIVFFVKKTNGGANVISPDGPGAVHNFMIFSGSGDGKVNVPDGGGYIITTATPTTNPFDATWHMVALAWNGLSALDFRYFVDKDEYSDTTASANWADSICSKDIAFGRDHTPAYWAIEGIDQIMLFDSILTQADINTLYDYYTS